MLIRPFVCAIVLAMSFPAMAEDSNAHTPRVDGVDIEQAWSRPTPPGTPMGVGYMTIHNRTAAPVRLLGASTPKAKKVSIHQTVRDEGIMRMMPMQSGLAIEPGQSVELKPLSYHLMLEGITQAMEVNEQVPITLMFERIPDQHAVLKVYPLDDLPSADEPNDPSKRPVMGH